MAGVRVNRVLEGRRSATAGVVLVALAALTDVLVGAGTILIPLLVVGPLVTAVRASVLHVAVVAVVALGVAVPLGEVDGIFLEGEHWADLAAIAVVGGLAMAVARSRDALTLSEAVSGRALAAERERRRRAELLARLGELLAAPLRADVQLEHLAGLLVGDLADVVVIDFTGPGATTVVRAADPQVAEDVRGVRERVPIDRGGSHPTATVLREGEPFVAKRITEDQMREWAGDPEHLELMRRLRYRSAIVVPLQGSERVLGALTCLRLGDAEPYSEDEQATVAEYARRAAGAVDKAFLHAELRATQLRLETILANVGESVVAIGTDGRFAFANGPAARLLGLGSADEMVGRSPEDLVLPFAATGEDGRALGARDLPHVPALRGEPAEPLVVHASYPDRTERWFVVRGAAVKDGAGRVVLVVVVTEDVTAVKRAELRQRLLAEASELMGASLDVESTLEAAARAAVPDLADWARLDLPDERGVLREVAVAHRDPSKERVLREWRRHYPPDPADDRGPWEVLRTGEPVAWLAVDASDVDRYARDERHAGFMREIDTRSVLIVPLVVADEVIGTLQLATTGDSGRLLGADDLELAHEIARRAAIAVENARLHQARSSIASTLQRSLLPPRLPDMPGLRTAARFRAATGTSEVGGDFYDVFGIDGSWFVCMGDVTGKGPGAASLTSLARYALRATALYERRPERALEQLNHLLLAEGDRRAPCTVVCVRLDVGADGVQATVACAGHPAPYLVTSGRDVRPVGPPGTLLGAFPEVRIRTETVRLRAGDSLVLFTDGVPDTRGAEGRFGHARLETLLNDVGPAEPEVIATSIDDALAAFQEGPQRDDVALLVLRAL